MKQVFLLPNKLVTLGKTKNMTDEQLNEQLTALWLKTLEAARNELANFDNPGLRMKYADEDHKTYLKLEQLEKDNGKPWDYYKSLPVVKEKGESLYTVFREIRRLERLEEEAKCPQPKPEGTVTLDSEFNMDGDIVITDPCYIEEWVRPEHSRDTIYGDWSCSVWECNGETMIPEKGAEPFGEFCADAGLVCVTHINKNCNRTALEDWFKTHSWCGCIINNFKGKVWYEIHRRWYAYKGNWEHDDKVIVCGRGVKDGKPFAFTTAQTGL